MGCWTESDEILARQNDYARGWDDAKATLGSVDVLTAALRHYACTCPPGECAMSDDGSDTPVDDTLCGRVAQVALAARSSSAPSGGGDE